MINKFITKGMISLIYSFFVPHALASGLIYLSFFCSYLTLEDFILFIFALEYCLIERLDVTLCNVFFLLILSIGSFFKSGSLLSLNKSSTDKITVMFSILLFYSFFYFL